MNKKQRKSSRSKNQSKAVVFGKFSAKAEREAVKKDLKKAALARKAIQEIKKTIDEVGEETEHNEQ